MSVSNARVNITSDGSVVTYNDAGIRIHTLCGDWSMLHSIVRLTRLAGKDKTRMPDQYKLRHTEFFFTREDTLDFIPIPIEHVIEMIKYIVKDDVEDFIMSLKIPK